MNNGERHVILVEEWQDEGIEISDNFVLAELEDHHLFPNQHVVELNEEDYQQLKLIIAIHEWTEKQFDYLYKRQKLDPKHTILDSNIDLSKMECSTHQFEVFKTPKKTVQHRKNKVK